MTGNASRFRVRWTARLSLIAFAALTLAYLPGCPGGGTSNIVKGKVTMDDKPVAGIVALVADGKKFEGPIGPNGEYVIPNPAPGTYKVTITPVVGAPVGGGVTAPVVKDKTDVQPKGDNLAAGGVQPPAKYHTADKTDLSIEYKSGVLEKNFALSK